jgi:hypothetical protein
MDTWNLITGLATLLGTAITIVSLAYGIYQSRLKKKLELFSLNSLQYLAGDIAKIQQSSGWAFVNVQTAQNEISQINNLPTKDIIMKISNAQGDTASTDRMITNLFNHILSLQESEFGSRIVKHPEAKDLPLIKRLLKMEPRFCKLY